VGFTMGIGLNKEHEIAHSLIMEECLAMEH